MTNTLGNTGKFSSHLLISLFKLHLLKGKRRRKRHPPPDSNFVRQQIGQVNLDVLLIPESSESAKGGSSWMCSSGARGATAGAEPGRPGGHGHVGARGPGAAQGPLTDTLEHGAQGQRRDRSRTRRSAGPRGSAVTAAGTPAPGTPAAGDLAPAPGGSRAEPPPQEQGQQSRSSEPPHSFSGVPNLATIFLSTPV